MRESAELGSRAWLIEPNTGEMVSYASLRSFIANINAVQSVCKPASTRAALEGIVASAAVGSRLTLLDRSIVPSEAERLGVNIAAINRLVPGKSRYPASSFPSFLRFSDNPEFELELFTSGSTGLPISVAHTLETLTRAVRVSTRHADDVWALAYPATHLAGVQVALQALMNGNTLVDVTLLRGAEAAEVICRYGITHVSATPTYCRLLAAAMKKMPLVRSITLGGEPVDEELLAVSREVFPNARLRNIYACTEAGTVLESDGDLFAVPHVLFQKVRIHDGRLLLHRSILARFSSGPRQSVANGDRQADWYDTGDRVEIITAHPLRFKITGRQNDWVNVGGDKVNPREVEAVLRQHESVLDVAVMSQPNSVLGSLLRADVVLNSQNTTEAELRAFAGERLQPFKVPRIIRFVDALNSTSSGKALRR